MRVAVPHTGGYPSRLRTLRMGRASPATRTSTLWRRGSSAPGLLQRSDLHGRMAGLQKLAIHPKFLTMEFAPRLDQPALRSGQAAADAFNRIDGVGRCRVQVVRMKAWPVKRGSRFHEHVNRDPEETGNLRHRLINRRPAPDRPRSASGRVPAGRSSKTAVNAFCAVTPTARG